MDAGRFGYLTKTASPVSRLFSMIAPVGLTDTPVPRPRLIAAMETPVLPASCAVTSGGTVETAGVQAPPPAATGIVARLLTKPPICTTTGTKHPVTPSGTVKRITSQAAIPCGIRKD